jgi:hypothetical protein
MKKPSRLLVPYQNKWVALTEDRKKVVASDLDVKKLTEKLAKMRKKDVILTYVIPMDKYYSPNVKGP